MRYADSRARNTPVPARINRKDEESGSESVIYVQKRAVAPRNATQSVTPQIR